VPRLERAPGVGLRVVAAAQAHGAPPGPEAIDTSKPPAGPSTVDVHGSPWEGGAGRL
jgi:hypothetical protein